MYILFLHIYIYIGINTFPIGYSIFHIGLRNIPYPSLRGPRRTAPPALGRTAPRPPHMGRGRPGPGPYRSAIDRESKIGNR